MEKKKQQDLQGLSQGGRNSSLNNIHSSSNTSTNMSNSNTNGNNDAMAKFKARTTYKPAVAAANGPKKIPTNGVNGTENSSTRASRASNASNSKAPLKTNSSVPIPRRPMEKTAPNRRSVPANYRGHQSVSPPKHRTASQMNVTGQIPTSRVKARLIQEEKKTMPKTPIVKFKDKFPNHDNSSSLTSKYMEETETLKELFKRPDTLSNFPRTVPGVRTGGMSPTKAMGEFQLLESSLGHYSSYGSTPSLYFNNGHQNGSTSPIKNGSKSAPGEDSNGNHRRHRDSTSGGSADGSSDGDRLAEARHRASEGDALNPTSGRSSTSGWSRPEMVSCLWDQVCHDGCKVCIKLSRILIMF